MRLTSLGPPPRRSNQGLSAGRRVGADEGWRRHVPLLLASLLLAGASATAVLGFDRLAAAQARSVTSHAVDDRERIARYLVRATMLHLDAANATGNYAVLYSLASPAFQAANPPARLAEAFRPLREGTVDLSIAAVEEPSWSAPPSVGPDGALYLAGTYRVPAGDLVFRLGFQPVQGQWRSALIEVAAVARHREARGGPAPMQP